jgi:S1-C subfamily serine protease
MPLTREALTSVRPAVCAVGYLQVPFDEFADKRDFRSFKIWGTGFVIAPYCVLTNRHVLRRLLQSAELNNIPKDQFVLQFNYSHAPTARQSYCKFKRWGYVLNDVIDLGIIDFAPPSVSQFDEVQPVRLTEGLDIQIGDSIAAFGFAFGSDHLEREINGERHVYRVGPILQQGYISAIAPFDQSPRVERLLLDLRTSPGMSGSPVFDPTSGIVIGIHDAGREATTAFAIPLDSSTITAVTESYAKAKDGEPFKIPVNAVRRI